MNEVNTIVILSDICKRIEEYGWACMHESSHGCACKTFYSIGLWENYQHPEIVITGMQPAYGHAVIINMISYIEKGAIAKANTITYDHIEDTDIGKPLRTGLIEVTKPYREKLKYLNLYNGYIDYPALQLLWPDPEGVLPIEPGYNTRYVQPVFNNDFLNIKLKEPAK